MKLNHISAACLHFIGLFIVLPQPQEIFNDVESLFNHDKASDDDLVVQLVHILCYYMLQPALSFPGCKG